MRFTTYLALIAVCCLVPSGFAFGQGPPIGGDPEGPNSGYNYEGWNLEAWNYYNLTVDGELYTHDIDGMKWDTEWLIQWPDSADQMDGTSDNKVSGFDTIPFYGSFVGWQFTYQVRGGAHGAMIGDSPEVPFFFLAEFVGDGEDQNFFYNDNKEALDAEPAMSTGTFQMRIDPDHPVNHGFWAGFGNTPANCDITIKAYEVWHLDGYGLHVDLDWCLRENMRVGFPYGDLPGR